MIKYLPSGIELNPRIVVLIILLIPFISSAQRVNEHGLKMVREVEVFDWELDKIILTYNEQNRLVGMTVYKDWNWSKSKCDARTYVPNYELYAEYNIKDGKMICKRYDEEYRDPLYDFKFDEWGHITSFKEKPSAAWLKGEIFEYEYDYSYDERMKRHVSTYGWFGDFADIREGKNLNFDIMNDTNISLWWILRFDNCEYSVDYYFMLSEWIDCINDYMLKPFWDNQYEYKYDSSGNLIELIENEQYTFVQIEVKDGKEYRYPYSVDTTIKLKYIY